MEDLGSLEMAVCLMFGTFSSHQNASGRLKKQDFMALLDSGLPNLSKDLDDDSKEKMFKDVDTDNSGSVDFKEFVELISSFAVASYDMLQEMSKNVKK